MQNPGLHLLCAQEVSPDLMGKAEVGPHTFAFPLLLSYSPCAWKPFHKALNSLVRRVGTMPRGAKDLLTLED